MRMPPVSVSNLELAVSLGEAVLLGVVIVCVNQVRSRPAREALRFLAGLVLLAVACVEMGRWWAGYGFSMAASGVMFYGALNAGRCGAKRAGVSCWLLRGHAGEHQYRLTRGNSELNFVNETKLGACPPSTGLPPISQIVTGPIDQGEAP